MFSERLKASRKSKGLTQKDLAAFLGISERGYQNYEMGKREPNLEVLKQLADFLGVTTDYLLGRSDSIEEDINPLLISRKLYLLSSNLFLLRTHENLTTKEMSDKLGIPEDLYKQLERLDENREAFEY
jgi:transcriptional regulator with XRE-family HTH domain